MDIPASPTDSPAVPLETPRLPGEAEEGEELRVGEEAPEEVVVTEPVGESVAEAPTAGLAEAPTDSLLSVAEAPTAAPGQTATRKPARTRSRPGGIYSQSVISRRIALSIANVGRALKQNLESLVASEIEGRCIVEGFVKPGSTRLLAYNSGLIRNGGVVFEVVFECMSCCPVEGMLIDCVAKNITKAGIRAEMDGDGVSPVVVFVARDHSHLNDYFNAIAEGDNIKVRVIGQRFELNDKYVSVIGEVVEQREFMHARSSKSKPRLIIPN